MVSRLHAKTNQIGKILNNLEKYNLLKDLEGGRSPSTPGSTKSFVKSSPLSPRGPPIGEKLFPQRSFDDQANRNRRSIDRGSITPTTKNENKTVEATLSESTSN